MTARERFKTILADALERLCVVEEQLELAQQKIVELEGGDAGGSTDRDDDPVR